MVSDLPICHDGSYGILFRKIKKNEFLSSEEISEEFGPLLSRALGNELNKN